MVEDVTADANRAAAEARVSEALRLLDGSPSLTEPPLVMQILGE